jgi:hypothetical protein
MNTKKQNHKWMSSPLAVAAMCCMGFGMTSSALQAQDMYDYDFDVPAERQISRPIEEFFIGRTVQTREAGELQMSVGGMHQRDGDLRFSEIRTSAEYGITDRLQLQAELPFQVNDQPSNFEAQTDVSNFQVGATYSLLRGDDPISLSAGMDVSVPVGNQNAMPDGMDDERTIWKPSLMVGRDLGPTQVHADVQGEIGQRSNGLNYNVGVVYPAGAIAPTMEFNARTTENASPQFYATPGLYYNFSERAELGVGVPIGLNDQSRDGQIMAKFNFKF